MSFYEQNRPEQVAFYKSYPWQKCRNEYFKKARGLCERCLSKGLIKQGEIVHHIIEMDENTIQNPELAFGFNNLQLVCRKCHDEIHENRKKYCGRSKRYKVDENGVVSIKE